MSTYLEQDYQKAGFGAALQPGAKAALIVIDAVKAYVVPESPLYVDKPEVLENIKRLIAGFREAGNLVIFTDVVYQANGLDGGVFYRKVPALRHFNRGSALGELPDGIEVGAKEVLVSKQYASSFFGTSLASTLIAANVDTVFLCGYSTSGCVRATAVDSIQNGFIPFVVGDASGDRDEAIQRSNLFDLQAKYAEVTSTNDALSLLLTTF